MPVAALIIGPIVVPHGQSERTTNSCTRRRRNNEEVFKASRELYEVFVANHGDEHENTIVAGKNYALRHQKADRGDEARELLTKLLATSKQVLGPHHNITKSVESVL